MLYSARDEYGLRFAYGRLVRCSLPNFGSYADRATCHQKAAATAAKMESSGTIQADPSETPVQPAPAKAASNPSGLRMTRDWSPDQLQFQPPPQRR